MYIRKKKKKIQEAQESEDVLRAIKRQIRFARAAPFVLVGTIIGSFAVIYYINNSDNVPKRALKALGEQHYPAFSSIYNIVRNYSEKAPPVATPTPFYSQPIDPLTEPAILIAENYTKNNCSQSDTGICKDMNELFRIGNNFFVTYRIWAQHPSTKKSLSELSKELPLPMTPDQLLEVATTTLALCAAKKGHALNTSGGEVAVLKMLDSTRHIKDCNFNIFSNMFDMANCEDPNPEKWTTLKRSIFAHRMLHEYSYSPQSRPLVLPPDTPDSKPQSATCLERKK